MIILKQTRYSPVFDEWLEKAALDYTLEDARDGLLEGSLVLAKIYYNEDIHGVVVFEPLPEISTLHIYALAAEGLPPDWHPEFLQRWIQVANYYKAHRLSLSGRKGWQRVLKRLGFAIDAETGNLLFDTEIQQ